MIPTRYLVTLAVLAVLVATLAAALVADRHIDALAVGWCAELIEVLIQLAPAALMVLIVLRSCCDTRWLDQWLLDARAVALAAEAGSRGRAVDVFVARWEGEYQHAEVTVRPIAEGWRVDLVARTRSAVVVCDRDGLVGALTELLREDP